MKNKWHLFNFVFIIFTLLSLTIGCDKDDPPPVEPGTVTDVDGNEYPTIQIGNQTWMAENLKTTKYSNGTAIEFPALDDRAWQQNTTGAYAWYNNLPENKDLYGASYNWHAVNNNNGLCPTGWRVATAEDWNTLLNYLGSTHRLTNDQNDVNAIGNKLKSCRQQNSPLGGECATNEHPRWNAHSVNYGMNDFGFNALPAGGRGIEGNYQAVGAFGFWWNSDEASPTHAQYRYINFDQSVVYHGVHPKTAGLAVRCVKN